MLLAQLGIVGALVNLSLAHPAANLTQVAVGALLLAFFAATQDIAMNAWRIESAPDAQQGAMAAAYQVGYRAAAHLQQPPARWGWRRSPAGTPAYATMAGLGLVGVITTLLVREPQPRVVADR